MLQSRNKQDRKTFRESLVTAILASSPLLELNSAQRKRLLDQLSQGWTVVPSQPDSDRIRGLRKVASDSRRLKQALARLSNTDAALLDDGFQHTISLSARLLMLEETAADAESMAATIQGRQRAVQQLQHGYASSRLIKVLEEHGIPCATRNDHEKRPVGDGLSFASSKSKRNYDYLPVLDCGATLAMRCAMLAMFDAGIVELDWSATVAAIKAGRQFQKSLVKCDQDTRKTSFALLRAFAAQRQTIPGNTAVIESVEIFSEPCESNPHGPH